MPYVAPSTVVAGQTYSASAHNVIVNDVIDHESRIVTAESDIVAVENSIRRLAHDTRTTNYTVSSTTLSGASDIFTDLTITADGTSAYYFEGFFPSVQLGAIGDSMDIILTDGGNTMLMLPAQYYEAARANQRTPIFFRFPYTPTAGSKSFNLRAVRIGSANGIIYAGAGGASVNMPIHFSIYGPALT